jgi:group I intron endonuclease
LLKYGQDYFAALIVEYVDIKNLTVRETYYITQILPYYNILKQGYSSIGYKHTEATPASSAVSSFGEAYSFLLLF